MFSVHNTHIQGDVQPIRLWRLKTKSEKSTCLSYTGLIGGLEKLKIETRLIDEMFASVMGEYVFLK